MTNDPVDPLYVAARRALLDATTALDDQLDGLILIGAQAVYFHTGAAVGLGAPPHTSDADLLLDRARLHDRPEIAATLRAAGLLPSTNPGHWVTGDGIAVDLMAAPHQTDPPPSRRSARLPPHAKETARLGPGLACALTDNTVHTVEALDPRDGRRARLRVAGPAALLVAKAVKIGDRLGDARAGQPGRVVDKDALDMFRILQSVEIDDLVAAWAAQRDSIPAAADVRHTVALLADPEIGSNRLPALATQAARNDPTVARSFALLARDLVEAAEGAGWR